MAYCVRCKKSVNVPNAKMSSAGGTQMLKGPCPKCGTTTCTIVGRSGGGKRSGRKARSGHKARSGRK